MRRNVYLRSINATRAQFTGALRINRKPALRAHWWSQIGPLHKLLGWLASLSCVALLATAGLYARTDGMSVKAVTLTGEGAPPAAILETLLGASLEPDSRAGSLIEWIIGTVNDTTFAGLKAEMVKRVKDPLVGLPFGRFDIQIPNQRFGVRDIVHELSRYMPWAKKKYAASVSINAKGDKASVLVLLESTDDDRVVIRLDTPVTELSNGASKFYENFSVAVLRIADPDRALASELARLLRACDCINDALHDVISTAAPRISEKGVVYVTWILTRTILLDAEKRKDAERTLLLLRHLVSERLKAGPENAELNLAKVLITSLWTNESSPEATTKIMAKACPALREMAPRIGCAPTRDVLVAISNNDRRVFVEQVRRWTDLSELKFYAAVLYAIISCPKMDGEACVALQRTSWPLDDVAAVKRAMSVASFVISLSAAKSGAPIEDAYAEGARLLERRQEIQQDVCQRALWFLECDQIIPLLADLELTMLSTMGVANVSEETARQTCRSALEYKFDAFASECLGDVSRREFNFKVAIDYYTAALPVARPNKDVLPASNLQTYYRLSTHIAYAEMMLGNFAEAEAALKASAAGKLDNWWVHDAVALHGVLAFRTCRIEEGKSTLTRFAKIDARASYWYHVLRVHDRLASGDLKGAKEAYDGISPLGRRGPHAMILAGQIDLRAGRRLEAMEHFSAAAAIAPQSRDAALFFARAATAEQADRARSLLEQSMLARRSTELESHSFETFVTFDSPGDRHYFELCVP